MREKVKTARGKKLGLWKRVLRVVGEQDCLDTLIGLVQSTDRTLRGCMLKVADKL